MRVRALLLAALALAGCQVATEGAPCRDAVSCPEGQACGADSLCSAKALACTHCAKGESACVAGGLAACAVAADGVCADFAAPVAPGPHQVCDPSSSGLARLVCSPSSCKVSGSTCVGATAEQGCEVDAVGCAFPTAEPQACRGIQTCAGVEGQGSCQCPAPAVAAGGGCANPGALSCDAAKRTVLACALDAASGCFAWRPQTDCATEAAVPGLVCGGTAPAAACFCPAAGGTAYVDADPSPRPSGLTATGALNPAACRFSSLADALGAAAPKSTVTVTGVPRAFAEPLLPAVPAGVTLTAPTAPEGAHWIFELSGTLKLGEGATLSGFELRPSPAATASFDAIETTCSSLKPKSTTTVSGVRITSPPGVRFPFAAGVREHGGCPTEISSTQITGGTTGILIDPPSGIANVTISTTVIEDAVDSGIQVFQLTSDSNITMTGNTIRRNCAATFYTYGGVKRGGGGVLFSGGLPTLAFHGNLVHGNAFDQILVANSIAAMSLNLVGDDAAASGTCPTAGLANQFTWPDTGRGVGVYSAGSSVHAIGNAWSGDPPTRGFDYDGPNNSVDVSGTGQQYCAGSTTVAPAPRTCGQ